MEQPPSTLETAHAYATRAMNEANRAVRFAEQAIAVARAAAGEATFTYSVLTDLMREKYPLPDKSLDISLNS